MSDAVTIGMFNQLPGGTMAFSRTVLVLALFSVACSSTNSSRAAGGAPDTSDTSKARAGLLAKVSGSTDAGDPLVFYARKVAEVLYPRFQAGPGWTSRPLPIAMGSNVAKLAEQEACRAVFAAAGLPCDDKWRLVPEHVAVVLPETRESDALIVAAPRVYAAMGSASLDSDPFSESEQKARADCLGKLLQQVHGAATGGSSYSVQVIVGNEIPYEKFFSQLDTQSQGMLSGVEFSLPRSGGPGGLPGVHVACWMPKANVPSSLNRVLAVGAAVGSASVAPCGYIDVEKAHRATQGAAQQSEACRLAGAQLMIEGGAAGAIWRAVDGRFLDPAYAVFPVVTEPFSLLNSPGCPGRELWQCVPPRVFSHASRTCGPTDNATACMRIAEARAIQALAQQVLGAEYAKAGSFTSLNDKVTLTSKLESAFEGVVKGINLACATDPDPDSPPHPKPVTYRCGAWLLFN